MSKKKIDFGAIKDLIKLANINDVKPNPNNPRKISKREQKKLVASIKADPKLLLVKPIVVDNDMQILGGNQRYNACVEIGMIEIPILNASMLSKEEQKKFVVIDNTHSGEWDWLKITDQYTPNDLEIWGLIAPVTPDILEKKEIEPKEFDKEFNKYDDTNAQLPITPEFHEKYAYFIILTTNEIDEEFIRNKFELNIKHTSHKSTDDRLSNIISFEKFQKICLK